MGDFDKDFINEESLIVFPFGGYLFNDFHYIQGIFIQFLFKVLGYLEYNNFVLNIYQVLIAWHNNIWTSTIQINGVLVKDLNQKETALQKEIP